MERHIRNVPNSPPPRPSLAVLLGVAGALLVGTPASAQDKTSEIDKIFGWATPDTPGCAVAVSQDGKLIVNRAYGLADLERGVPLTRDSVFDVGSIRKQFVAAAILLLVEEGRLSLADDIRQHIPELPDYGHTITVDHLLTHAGLFFNQSTGEPLRLAANNGRLGIAGGPTLVTVTRDRFRNPRGSLSFMSQDEFELHFQSDDQFELKSMEGQTTRYRRAQPYAPTADDLKAFAGRYESDELRAVIELALGTAGLTGRLNDVPAPGFPFRPVGRDTFQFGRITMRFLRDNAGKVVALDFSNPVLRSIRFTRVSDRSGDG
jgi:hypothetical protein